MSELPPARLRPVDLLRVGASGLRARRLRVLLAALGIAIGITAMVAVVGISTSSRIDLQRQLSRLGTNMLTVTPGSTITGDRARLPERSVAMVSRIGPVRSATAVGRVPNTMVYRNEHIPVGQTNSIVVYAAHLNLLTTVRATMATGSWLTPATDRYPAVVLGAKAAQRLGIPRPSTGVRVVIGGQRVAVVGILQSTPLAPELDLAALIGWSAARQYFGFDGSPTILYVRTYEHAVSQVRSVLAASANPERPDEVAVSRPSDALAAQAAVDRAFTRLLLGLGAVALLVGGIGVANTMVISVLERRAEIGLRRSLGATRGHVRWQFLVESLLLSLIGGVCGVLLGVAVTTGYAAYQHWPAVVPVWGTAGAVAATLLIGGLAGIYPAMRAARLSPTEALAAP